MLVPNTMTTQQLLGFGQTEPTVERYTAYKCNPRLRDPAFPEGAVGAGYTCIPNDPAGMLLYMNIQDAINHAAVKLGMDVEPLEIDGKLGATTANLALQALLAAPKTAQTEKWLFDPRVTNPAYLAEQLAIQPRTAITTFDEISGFNRPAALIDPRAQQDAVNGEGDQSKPLPPQLPKQPRKGLSHGAIIALAASGGFLLATLITLTMIRKR